MNVEHRPWGFFRVVEETPTYKIKLITIYPNQKTSLQKHEKRQEHWVILEGLALIMVGDFISCYTKNDKVSIGKNIYHRIENVCNENVVFIEIQTGEYFGEEDIYRINDVYGRE